MMKIKIKIKISLLGYWFIGTGHEAGAYADSICLRDKNGLPYIPGKTLKGLFRNAFQYCTKNGVFSNSELNYLFGIAGTSLDPEKQVMFLDDDFDELKTSGILNFNSCEFSALEKKQIIENNYASHLFKTVQSTAIENGIAKNESLRSYEVCIPVNFETYISVDEHIIQSEEFSEYFDSIDELKRDLATAATLITEIGGKRRRGFGRCTVEVK